MVKLIQVLLQRTKCYEVNFNAKSEVPNIAARSHKESHTERSILKCRHIVVLVGFAVYLFLAIHRMNINISIVAMVKQPTPNDLNTSSESCPAVAKQVNEVKIAQNSFEKVGGEFDWSPIVQGYILGSSFIGYFFTQFIGGKLSEIYGCKWIIFWGLLLASISTFVTPFVSWWNVYILIAAQTLRGMGQGVFQGSFSVLSANWFPMMERGCLFTFIMSGNAVGVFIGGLITGYLCESSVGGWPSVFYSCGGAGIVLAFLIAFILYDSPSVHPRISETELNFIQNNQESKLSQRRPNTPWRYIFTSIPIYALAFAVFGQFWEGAYFLAIYPTFLGTILHIPIAQNGIITSVSFLIQAVFTLIASCISNFLNKKNYVGVDKIRKFWNLMSCTGYSVFLIGIYYARCNTTMSIIFSFLSLACVGFGFAGSSIVSADMTPTFAGSVAGLTCTLGSISSFILPLIVGFLTDGMQTFEQWNKIIFISIGVVMASGITFCLFGSAEVQIWNYTEEKASKREATEA